MGVSKLPCQLYLQETAVSGQVGHLSGLCSEQHIRSYAVTLIFMFQFLKLVYNMRHTITTYYGQSMF